MDLGIRGKRALVAGGSAGMGKACANALALAGVEIVISARSRDRLEATAAEISAATGSLVTPVVADHGTEEGRSALLNACPEPDILVITCSPPRSVRSHLEISPAEWRAVFETTFIGPVELMRATVDGMVERRFGRIVNIGTVGAKRPIAERVLSGAPRAALANFSVALAQQVARHNVAINSILPGLFHTEGSLKRYGELASANGRTYEEETRSRVRELNVPAQRFGDPADIGAACALLCSAHSSFTIGQSLTIDGGQHLSLF